VSYQRRHGVIAKIWKTKLVTDDRGNQLKIFDENDYEFVSVAQIPQRSGRAEVVGQVAINVVRIIVDPNLVGVDLWARVELNGVLWDIVTPPAYHHGTRHTRHWSIDLRERG